MLTPPKLAIWPSREKFANDVAMSAVCIALSTGPCCCARQGAAALFRARGRLARMRESYQPVMSMANSITWRAVSGSLGLNSAQLAKLSKLTSRQLRELVRLGAVSHASSRGVRSGYGRHHLEEARRARRLLDLGLSCHAVAAVVHELGPRQRPPKSLLLPAFRSDGGHAIHWLAGSICISAPETRSSSEQRLIDAIRAAVDQFRARERAVRAAITTR